MAKRRKTAEEVVNEIRTACAALGWHIGLDESDETVSGLIIGQEQYVEKVLEQLEDMENYGIFDAGVEDINLQ
jgi:endonuclease III-like uncharacterized protein